MTDLAKAALSTARLGFPVFPVAPRGKKPLIPKSAGGRGYLDATTDADAVAKWWSTWPNANIGLACGGPRRLLVVDVDGLEGAQTLSRLEAQNGALPKTIESVTGTGGRHIWLQWPDDDAPTSASRLGPKIDTRGVGGYIVAPPSTHPTGKRYSWSTACGNSIVEAPWWLIECLAAGPKAAQPADDWRRLAIEGASEGDRNSSVAKLAGHLLRKYVDPIVARELVSCWNLVRCSPPLEEDEVVKTVNSVAAKELRRRASAS